MATNLLQLELYVLELKARHSVAVLDVLLHTVLLTHVEVAAEQLDLLVRQMLVEK